MPVVQNVGALDSNTEYSPARENVAAITRAALLLGLSVRQVTSQGEAMIIAFRSGRQCADVECFEDGDALAVTYNQNGEPRCWDVSLDDDGIKDTLRTIQRYISQS